MTGQRCAAHRKLHCVECAHQRTQTVAVNVDPTALVGADARGNPRAGEPEVWTEIRDKLDLHLPNLVEALTDLFFIVWGVEFTVTLVWFIIAVGGSK